jgi:hypothetical protein
MLRGVNVCLQVALDKLREHLQNPDLSKEHAKDIFRLAKQTRLRINAERRVASLETRDRQVAAIQPGSSHMSCYVCHETGKAGTSPGTGDSIGSCIKCNILACAAHGKRYGKFECAVCNPATAALTAMTGGISGPATSQADALGSYSNTLLQERTEAAVRRAIADSRSSRQLEDHSLATPDTDSPNIVTDLAAEIRRQRGEDEQLTAAAPTDSERTDLISLDAIGAAVRERLAGLELTEPDIAAVRTVTGALLLGYYLADARTAARRDDAPSSWPRNIESLPRPWKVTYPILLDPVLWMLGTALAED